MKTTIILLSCFALSGGLLGCAAGEVGSEADMGSAREDVEHVGQAEGAVFAADSPAPEDVFIEGITTGGVGCPDHSTVSSLISSDRASFLVIFDQMILANPPGPLVKNTNCVAGVRLHIPNGWQFSIATVNTRGYAFLSQGQRARQTSKYFFAGNPIATAWHSSLTGPHDGNYSFTDEIGFQSTSWSPCGGSAIFAIDTSLNLNVISNAAGTAFFNTETVDGTFKKHFHWQWQRC